MDTKKWTSVISTSCSIKIKAEVYSLVFPALSVEYAILESDAGSVSLPATHELTPCANSPTIHRKGVDGYYYCSSMGTSLDRAYTNADSKGP